MSQHPSLRIETVGSRHRNVLKRFERVKKLQEQNKWKNDASAFGLPKVKSMKIKVKKIKETPAEEAAAAAGAPAGAPAVPAAKGAAAAPKTAAGKPAAAAKPAAPAAGAKPKAAEKK